MSFARPIHFLATLGLAAGPAFSALTINSIPNTAAAPAGFVSNDITIDTDLDILSAAVYIKLDTGTLYNPNPLLPDAETFQQSPGDTYVTIGGNPNSYIAGSAGDLGHHPVVPGAAEFGPTTLGVAYYDISHDDIGIGLPMGTFSFSDDATGRGIMSVGVSSGPRVYVPFDITSGALPDTLPEPQTTFTPLDPPTYPPPPQLPPAPPGAPPAYFQYVPQSVVPGVIVNDLVINTDTDWQNASLVIELYEGTVFNSQLDMDTPFPPEVSQIPGLEDLAYDTYVGVVGDRTTIVLGSAAGAGPHYMEGPLVDVSWSNAATSDTGTFAIGRFSLSHDAYGFATLNVDGYTDTIPIFFGFIGSIPEPATLTILALTGPVLLRRQVN